MSCPVVLVRIAYSQACCLVCLAALDKALLNGATVAIGNYIRQLNIHPQDTSFILQVTWYSVFDSLPVMLTTSPAFAFFEDGKLLSDTVRIIRTRQP